MVPAVLSPPLGHRGAWHGMWTLKGTQIWCFPCASAVRVSAGPSGSRDATASVQARSLGFHWGGFRLRSPHPYLLRLDILKSHGFQCPGRNSPKRGAIAPSSTIPTNHSLVQKQGLGSVLTYLLVLEIMWEKE